MLQFRLIPALVIAGLVIPLSAETEKLTDEDRLLIVRGMNAEYATAKTLIPRSKKPLKIKQSGEWDKQQWDEAALEFGPAARVGDLVQITKVEIEKGSIKFELNGGMSGRRKWYERIEVGMGSRTTPISRNDVTAAPGGTSIELVFDKRVPSVDAVDLKKMLASLLDFDKRTATEQAIDTMPPEIAEAVRDKRVVEGMDRDQVVLAMGKPRNKVRETSEGLDTEDWIYGLPPGKVTFVTFANGKVVQVKEAYAGLGGSTVPTMKPPL